MASAPARSSSGSDRPTVALAALLATLVALVLGTGCTGDDGGFRSAPGNAVVANAEITKIVDGDTIDVGTGGASTRIRMIGFDTPESVDPRRPVECFGKEASSHLAELAPVGTQVRLERDAEEHDRYGRTLAYVYRASDGRFLNLQMVTDGYANVLSIPPNVAFAAEFRAAERDARTTGRGLWSACPSEPG